jgi:hypothetical protein
MGERTVKTSIARMGAVASAEIRFRFRRTTALVAWLVVAASVYVIIPDPRTGWALMRIRGMRALYNSAAVALGTGLFCSIVLSLAGYYLVSNSIRRDIRFRTGIIIAATPVSNLECLAGRFLGNLTYLFSIVLACMVSAMLMFLLRGESSLEPWVFISTYAWLTTSVAVFCSAMALGFESLPLLSGRMGDGVYFFVWAAILSVPAAVMAAGMESAWSSVFDVTGIGVLIRQLHTQLQTEEMTIGGASIDPALPTILFPGLTLSKAIFLERALVCIPPLFFFGLAGLWFHRFDPARITGGRQGSVHRRTWIVNRLLKPATRMLWNRTLFPRRMTIRGAMVADVMATLSAHPLALLAAAAFGLACLVLDWHTIVRPVLPVMFLLLTFILAEISARDASSGMMHLLFSAPKLRERYILWKFLSLLTITLMFTVIPIVRLVPVAPQAALSVLTGSIFVAAIATAFGTMTASPKLFIGSFLMLLYVSLNSSDAAALDFAGFNLHATTRVSAVYASIGLLLLLCAEMRHRRVLLNM